MDIHLHNPIPDFIIVGAPKCGTTSLYEYLRTHPEIYLPERKEPHFFGKDLFSPEYIRDKEQYLALYKDRSNKKIVGEASVWYLFSKLAAQEIYTFNPNTKIIILVRNPIEVMYSYHSQRLWNGTENCEDFEVALSLENQRKKGYHLPQNPHPIFGLFYRDIVQFSSQIKRYQSIFPKEQLLIIDFDDFITNTKSTYLKVLSYLKVSSFESIEFNQHNKNKTIRFPWLRDFLLLPTPTMKTILHTIFPQQSLRKTLGDMLRRLLSQKVERPPLDSELREKLIYEFSDEIDRLSDITGMDFSEWKAKKS